MSIENEVLELQRKKLKMEIDALEAKKARIAYLRNEISECNAEVTAALAVINVKFNASGKGPASHQARRQRIMRKVEPLQDVRANLVKQLNDLLRG